MSETHSFDFLQEWRKFRGNQPIGRLAHWCNEWDGLPTDENCREWGDNPLACCCGFNELNLRMGVDSNYV